MIEDDIRDILAGQIPGVTFISRLIPMALPECVVVQEIDGGTPSTAGIRRASHRISLMAISSSQRYAQDLRDTVRTVLIKNIPADLNGTHYYTARPLDTSSHRNKTPAGPKYIEIADMEVVASLS